MNVILDDAWWSRWFCIGQSWLVVFSCGCIIDFGKFNCLSSITMISIDFHAFCIFSIGSILHLQNQRCVCSRSWPAPHFWPVTGSTTGMAEDKVKNEMRWAFWNANAWDDVLNCLNADVPWFNLLGLLGVCNLCTCFCVVFCFQPNCHYVVIITFCNWMA